MLAKGKRVSGVQPQRACRRRVRACHETRRRRRRTERLIQTTNFRAAILELLVEDFLPDRRTYPMGLLLGSQTGTLAPYSIHLHAVKPRCKEVPRGAKNCLVPGPVIGSPALVGIRPAQLPEPWTWIIKLAMPTAPRLLVNAKSLPTRSCDHITVYRARGQLDRRTHARAVW